MKRKAFTLVELLVVLAIIGILFAILVPLLSTIFSKGEPFRGFVMEKRTQLDADGWTEYVLTVESESGSIDAYYTSSSAYNKIVARQWYDFTKKHNHLFEPVFVPSSGPEPAPNNYVELPDSKAETVPQVDLEEILGEGKE